MLHLTLQVISTDPQPHDLGNFFLFFVIFFRPYNEGSSEFDRVDRLIPSFACEY